MGAYATHSATSDIYHDVVMTLRRGFYGRDGKLHRPSPQTAAIIVTQANIGVRIGDLLSLHLADIVREGNFWRLNISEEKTGKQRPYPVPDPVYKFLASYCAENGISSQDRIFPVTPRAVQKQLKAVCDYLGYGNISTHSFRKFAGQEIYKASGYDIEAAREFYQHSSVQITQLYLRRTSRQLESAIEKSVHII